MHSGSNKSDTWRTADTPVEGNFPFKWYGEKSDLGHEWEYSAESVDCYQEKSSVFIVSEGDDKHCFVFHTLCLNSRSWQWSYGGRIFVLWPSDHSSWRIISKILEAFFFLKLWKDLLVADTL